jgi:uncharacterized protein YbbK (DUF523 family)
LRPGAFVVRQLPGRGFFDTPELTNKKISRSEKLELVLVSACLLGESVRYNGGHKLCEHTVLRRWFAEGRVVAVCPEVEGGLSVPRPAAEIEDRAGGASVLLGHAKVMDTTGRNVSAQFVKGAEQALAQARAWNIRIAILKEGSPSCGSRQTYDGSFTQTKTANAGVTAALLQREGIHVFSEEELAEADALLTQLMAGDG